MIVKSDTDHLKLAAAVLIGALVLRATWGALVPVVPMSDGHAYDILARTLVEHGVYGWSATRPSAYWPPGTSAVYAALYSLFGQSYKPIVILNVILSTGLVGLTMWLGCNFLDKTTGILAGFIMAMWPGEVFYVTILSSELPFTFFVLAGCAIWFDPRLPNSVRAVACGLAFAAATYFRPIGLLLPIVLWLSALPKWQKLRQELPVAVLAMVVIVVAVAPWSIRNTKVFGHFVPIATADGVNLWIGNNANSNGYYMPLPASVDGLGEYEQDKSLEAEARRYIFDNPGTFILRGFKKAALLHVNETIAVVWNTDGIALRFGESVIFPLKVIARGFWTGILLLALGGIVILVRKQGVLQTLANPAVLIWIYFTAVYSVFFADERFHLPSHPFISMLAAVAILVGAKVVPSRAVAAGG